MPSAAITDDDYSSVESINDRIVSAAGPCCEAPGGDTEVLVPPSRLSARLKVPTPPPPHPPWRSRSLRGEEAPNVNLEAHPDYV